MSKTIPQLSTVPGGVQAANLFFEVARQITAGNFNGESEKIAGDALLSLFAGTSLTLNIIQRLNPTGLAYDPTKTYTLYDYLDVAYQGKHYAYIGAAPSAGHAPPDLLHWLLISSDGGGGGIAWTEYLDPVTSPVNLLPNSGVISSGTTDTEFVLPDAASVEVGDRIIVQGKGSGIWSLTGATIRAIGGASGTALRRLSSNPYAACELRAINSVTWIIISPSSLEFLEFFDSGGGAS